MRRLEQGGLPSTVKINNAPITQVGTSPDISAPAHSQTRRYPLVPVAGTILLATGALLLGIKKGGRYDTALRKLSKQLEEVNRSGGSEQDRAARREALNRNATPGLQEALREDEEGE